MLRPYKPNQGTFGWVVVDQPTAEADIHCENKCWCLILLLNSWWISWYIFYLMFSSQFTRCITCNLNTYSFLYVSYLDFYSFIYLDMWQLLMRFVSVHTARSMLFWAALDSVLQPQNAPYFSCPSFTIVFFDLQHWHLVVKQRKYDNGCCTMGLMLPDILYN